MTLSSPASKTFSPPGSLNSVLKVGQNAIRTSGSGTSARSVAQSSFEASPASSVLSGITEALDRLYGLTERNTARSEEQAKELRSWQERQNQLAMDFNAAEASKNRDWQKMMSDTAHQREVADLQAAGLNPILSASGGNGAAVTSGATASGVTSSGAKGEVDTSMSQGLVQLFGALLSAQTSLENQRVSAQTNLAIAERNNSSSQLIAQWQMVNSRQLQEISGQYGISQAKIHAAATEMSARLSSSASVTSAQIHAAASQAAAQIAANASQKNAITSALVSYYNTQASLQNALDVAGIHAQSALDVAKEQHKNSAYGSAWTIADGLAGAFDSLFKSSPYSSGGSFGGGGARR